MYLFGSITPSPPNFALTGLLSVNHTACLLSRFYHSYLQNPLLLLFNHSFQPLFEFWLAIPPSSNYLMAIPQSPSPSVHSMQWLNPMKFSCFHYSYPLLSSMPFSSGFCLFPSLTCYSQSTLHLSFSLWGFGPASSTCQSFPPTPSVFCGQHHNHHHHIYQHHHHNAMQTVCESLCFCNAFLYLWLLFHSLFCKLTT